jgi:hypothetical protein
MLNIAVKWLAYLGGPRLTSQPSSWLSSEGFLLDFVRLSRQIKAMTYPRFVGA